MTESLVKNIRFNLIALLVSFFTSTILLFSLIIFPVFQFSLVRVSLELLMIRLIVFIVPDFFILTMVPIFSEIILLLVFPFYGDLFYLPIIILSAWGCFGIMRLSYFLMSLEKGKNWFLLLLCILLFNFFFFFSFFYWVTKLNLYLILFCVSTLFFPLFFFWKQQGILLVFLLVLLMNSWNYLLMPLMSIVDSRLLVLINYDFLISIRIAKLPLNFVFDFFILFPTLVLLIKTRRIVFKQNTGYMYNPSLSGI